MIEGAQCSCVGCVLELTCSSWRNGGGVLVVRSDRIFRFPAVLEAAAGAYNVIVFRSPFLENAKARVRLHSVLFLDTISASFFRSFLIKLGDRGSPQMGTVLIDRAANRRHLKCETLVTNRRAEIASNKFRISKTR